jgi:hypothetical protein
MKHLERIKTICDNYFNIDISVKTRAREYADARKMYYKLSRDLLRKPVKKIASIVNVDHSTVIVGSQRLDELISIDKDIEENYLTLRDKCLNDGAIFNIHTTDINNMANPYLKYLGKEDILQHSVMEYMKNKYSDVYCIHVPNEGKRTPFMQFKFKYLGGQRGIPDILIFKQNKKGKCGLAIELKVGYNKPTENQFNALESLKKANWECHWLNDYEKTIQIIDEYFK